MGSGSQLSVMFAYWKYRAIGVVTAAAAVLAVSTTASAMVVGGRQAVQEVVEGCDAFALTGGKLAPSLMFTVSDPADSLGTMPVYMEDTEAEQALALYTDDDGFDLDLTEATKPGTGQLAELAALQLVPLQSDASQAMLALDVMTVRDVCGAEHFDQHSLWFLYSLINSLVTVNLNTGSITGTSLPWVLSIGSVFNLIDLGTFVLHDRIQPILLDPENAISASTYVDVLPWLVVESTRIGPTWIYYFHAEHWRFSYDTYGYQNITRYSSAPPGTSGGSSHSSIIYVGSGGGGGGGGGSGGPGGDSVEILIPPWMKSPIFWILSAAGLLGAARWLATV